MSIGSTGYGELSWDDGGRVEPLDVSFVGADGESFTVPCEELSSVELRRTRPVRAPRSCRGQAHFCGEYWSATTGTLLAWESRQELVHLMRLDQGQTWCHLSTQPLRVRFFSEGKVRSHVPDLLAIDDEGSVHVVDVKMTEHLGDPLVRASFSATKEAVGRAGWSFAVATEMSRELVANLRWLAGFRRPFIADEDIAAWLVAACAKPRPIGEVIASTAWEAEVRPVLMHVLWTGELGCALDEVLSDDTVVVSGRTV